MLKRNPFRMKSAWVFFCSISMGPPSAAWMLWAYLLTRFASFPIAASMALCTWIKALSHYPKPCLGCCLFPKLSAFLFAFFLNLVASCCLLGPQAAQLKQTTPTASEPCLLHDLQQSVSVAQGVSRLFNLTSQLRVDEGREL